jgi:hypothetical protein
MVKWMLFNACARRAQTPPISPVKAQHPSRLTGAGEGPSLIAMACFTRLHSQVIASVVKVQWYWLAGRHVHDTRDSRVGQCSKSGA